MKMLLSLVAGLALAGTLVTGALAQAPTTVTIQMKELNGSGENGTATLTQESDGVLVEVTLTGAPTDTPQPTHIHIGTCGKINKAPEYGLKNTVAGKSSTTVPGIKLADLLAGKYAINVHKSASELGTYVSCGNIVEPAK
ncbi:MAG TPA: hypothetical protein VMA98_09915 [Candidatus Acidoferrales bacterium]|nr:hypothetical protein [Candidatus Acidoferrales bacterium]